MVTRDNGLFIFTARKRSLRRLCFYTCLSVQGRGAIVGRGACVAGVCMVGGREHAWQRGQAWQGVYVAGGHAWHTPPQQILWDTTNERAVLILLECILVFAIANCWWLVELPMCFTDGFWPLFMELVGERGPYRWEIRAYLHWRRLGFQTWWLHCIMQNISHCMTWTQIPTPCFCTGQESEPVSVPDSVSSNVHVP